MTLDFKKTIDHILAREKGYVDHPSDRGGPTNYGITQATARVNGFTGHMRDLPLQLARDIYLKRYITGPRFDEVAKISEKVAAELIDTGVNMGPGRASEMLQRWLNGLNQEGSRYADLFVDGQLGSVTLEALRAYVAWRKAEGIDVLVCALNCTQGVRYLELAEDTPSQEDFLYGWLKSRVLLGASE